MDTLLDLQKKPQPGRPPRETTTDLFEQDVLQRSMERAIVVDFWAPWCGPCKQIMPLLEKAIAATNGAVEMVKVDIDKNPELVQIFRVQSVPMVYAFFKGHPVDGFMGVRPESEIKAFIDKLAKLSAAAPKQEGPGDPEAAKKLKDQADNNFQGGLWDAAMEKYALALDADPACAAALGGIGWCLLALGDAEGLRALAEDADDVQKGDPSIKGLLAVLALADDAAGLPPVEALEKAAAQNPKNLQGLYDLAQARINALDLAGAIAALTDLTRLDREWREQQARKLLLSLFDAMGPRHPLTLQGRRALSSILFS